MIRQRRCRRTQKLYVPGTVDFPSGRRHNARSTGFPLKERQDVYRTQRSRETGQVKPKPVFVGLVPPEHKNPALLYESYQVEKLRKSAPVRTYYGNLGPKGERGHQWRLKLQMLTPHGVEDEEAFKPQSFSLIEMIADLEKKVQVYDEMAQIVQNRFQSQNLTIRATARVRTKQ